LIEHFIEKFCRRHGKPQKRLSAEVYRIFLTSDWPGNVREMENLIERAVLLARGEELQVGDFWDQEEDFAAQPTELAITDSAGAGLSGQKTRLPEDFGETSLREMERQMIMSALRKTDNNRTHPPRCWE
jgi:two-component system, response regulator FlrC